MSGAPRVSAAVRVAARRRRVKRSLAARAARAATTAESLCTRAARCEQACEQLLCSQQAGSEELSVPPPFFVELARVFLNTRTKRGRLFYRL